MVIYVDKTIIKIYVADKVIHDYEVISIRCCPCCIYTVIKSGLRVENRKIDLNRICRMCLDKYKCKTSFDNES